MPQSPHVGEQLQMRILYAAIYLDLGIIPSDKLPILEKQLEIEASKFVNIFPCKLKMLFPTLSKVVFALKKTTVGIDRSTALSRFKWLVRDSPDNLLLRYVRMCGSTIDACVALGQAIRFQIEGYDAEQEQAKGELYYLEAQPQFIQQLKSSKAHFGTKDAQGRPVIVCRAKNFELAGESRTADCRMMCSLLELAYLCLNDEHDGVVFVLDLSGWDTVGWDYPLVRLLLELLASGPPLVHRLFIYKPPSGFSMFWALYKRFVTQWLVLKVTVVNRAKDMAYVVPLTSLPKYVGGKSNLSSLWTPPKAEDDLVDPEAKEDLLQQRHDLAKTLEKATAQWLFKSTIDRTALLDKYTALYWQLDPHVRSRTVWDRTGVLGLYRDELKFGGVAQPLCRSYLASSGPESTNGVLGEELKVEASTPSLVERTTPDACSLNTLIDPKVDAADLVKLLQIDPQTVALTEPHNL